MGSVNTARRVYDIVQNKENKQTIYFPNDVTYSTTNINFNNNWIGRKEKK